jgi:chromosome segregation ATPase
VSYFNRLKLLTHWRKIMRLAKTEALKKEIKFSMQNHERDVDAKVAIISMFERYAGILIDSDLDEADEQYQMALRNHFTHVDQLIAIQESRMQGLHEEFERDVKILKDEYDREKEEIKDLHHRERGELEGLIDTVKKEEASKEEAAKRKHDTDMESLRTANTDELTNLETKLSEKIKNVHQTFQNDLSNFKSQTGAKYQEYETLMSDTNRMTEQISKKKSELERLRKEIEALKAKKLQTETDMQARERSLKEKKAKIQKHSQELKYQMHQFREAESARLTELIVNSKKCMDTLKEDQKIGEKILKTAELCRKLETERVGSDPISSPRNECSRSTRTTQTPWPTTPKR